MCGTRGDLSTNKYNSISDTLSALIIQDRGSVESAKSCQPKAQEGVMLVYWAIEKIEWLEIGEMNILASRLFGTVCIKTFYEVE